MPKPTTKPKRKIKNCTEYKTTCKTLFIVGVVVSGFFYFGFCCLIYLYIMGYSMDNNIVFVNDENNIILESIESYTRYIINVIESICLDYKIDISKLSNSDFGLICNIIGERIYKHNPMLLKCNNNKHIYDTNKVNMAISVFDNILSLYALQYFEKDIVNYLNISSETLLEWRQGKRLNPENLLVAQNLRAINLTSHEKHCQSGKVNPVSELSYLNRYFGYSNNTFADNESKKELVSLPKLGSNLSLSDGQTDI